MIKKSIISIAFLILPVALFGFHGFTANGDSVITLYVNEPIVLSGYFDSDTHAIGTIYLDLNNNGVIDPTDQMMMWGSFYDGSWMDVDEIVNGFYTESDSEGPPFSFDVIYQVEDTGGSDQIIGHFLPLSTGYSISGQITYPSNAEGLLIMATPSSPGEFMLGDFTDSGGNYFIGIPDSLINQYWYVFAMDIASAFPDYLGPLMQDSVYVTGAQTVDLALIDSDLSCIRGRLQDDLGAALPDDIAIEIMGAWFDGVNFVMATNSIRTVGGNGNYAGLLNYGVVNFWTIGTMLDELYPLYLSPPSIDTTFSAPQETLLIDITAYRADSDIRGIVYLDDVPVDYIEIDGVCPLGSNYTKSYSDGHYGLFVSSVPDSYDVFVSPDDIPVGGYVAEDTQTVVPGASGVDFHIYTTGIAEHLKPTNPVVKLLPNNPNPFNNKTTIVFETNSKTEGELSIYDITGKLVKTLERGEFKKGINRFVWDGRDDNKRLVSSGVYFYKLQTERIAESQKLIYIR
ncbi:MAG: T9SS type A sorting domain-containing protein [Candidatus Cloacimonadota bacterium]|nr:MAG: T9SS type A sorting domain-containing protein [Candidatus Cloacimonadota bacterium]